MRRICKLIGIIIVIGIVFFVISDEKGYEIKLENNQIVFNKVEKKSDLIFNENLQKKVIYKNSDLIRINYEFKNPRSLSKSNGIDYEYLAKLENDKKLQEEMEKKQKTVYTGPSIIALNEEDTISSVFISGLVGNDVVENSNEGVSGVDNLSGKVAPLDNGGTGNDGQIILKGKFLNLSDFPKLFSYTIEKYEYNKHKLNLAKGVGTGNLLEENIDLVVDFPELQQYSIDLKKGKQSEVVFVKVEKYQPNKHGSVLRKGFFKENNFLVDGAENNNQGLNQNENYLSDSMLANLLEDDEIDVTTLESENDEFLQKVFEKTMDVDVMNLIVENYLSEYQFLKAKKFIEGLPERYLDELNPLLNLRVAFNSFPLSSKKIDENLISLIDNYKVKISNEDKNRYLGVIALMDRNYDKFFEISSSFTSEKNKAFTSKLQGYKDQISKQMGMPEYYFDTLVSLELFNQGLFQSAKILALYSLQQNSDYILPYQILAYANFLTNSWDTSVEYLKKLVDLDPNNAEKYRFLMGVAYYWAEKYEQSVTMLSTIQNENLRLDTQRYLINDYLKLDQKNKLISTRNKLLGYENLVASDFYTYFYEAFFHPYSEGTQFQIFAFDTELANKMIRVCSMRLPDDEKVVCMYGTIGRNVALGKFEGLEEYLLDLTAQYPQGYLYQALGEYYLQQGVEDKAKLYLLKAVSMANNKIEVSQIKKLLQTLM